MNIAIIPHEGRHVAVDIHTGLVMHGVRAIQTLQSDDETMPTTAMIEVEVLFMAPPPDWTEGTPLVELPEQEVDVL